MNSDTVTTISDLKQQVQKFVTDREWNKYHTVKNLTASIAIEAAELMELCQWKNEEEVSAMTADATMRAKFKDELADIIAYCLSLANTADIDVTKAVIEKIAKNDVKYPIEKVKGKYTKYTDL